MTAIGVMLIGFGILTAWSGFELVNVFELIRSFIGAPALPSAPSSSTTATPAGTSSPAPRPPSNLAPGGNDGPVTI